MLAWLPVWLYHWLAYFIAVRDAWHPGWHPHLTTCSRESPWPTWRTSWRQPSSSSQARSTATGYSPMHVSWSMKVCEGPMHPSLLSRKYLESVRMQPSIQWCLSLRLWASAPRALQRLTGTSAQVCRKHLGSHNSGERHRAAFGSFVSVH